jgi:ribosomal protein S18 acetylase RimI-like enzyme
VESGEALARAWAFERAVQDRCAARTREFEFGTALYNEQLRRVYDANLVRFERGFEELDGDTVETAADELQAGLAHRKVVVPDEQAGARLAAELKPRGWRAYVLVSLAYEGPGEIEAPRGARAVTERAVSPAREEALVDGTRDAEARRQIGEFTGLLAQATASRTFAARAGDVIGSFCTLFQEGGVGQIDEVTTIGRHRRRGLARRVVLAALAASLADGDELTFLVADDGDWPSAWYARLGFRPVGRRYELLRT